MSIRFVRKKNNNNHEFSIGQNDRFEREEEKTIDCK